MRDVRGSRRHVTPPVKHPRDAYDDAEGRLEVDAAAESRWTFAEGVPEILDRSEIGFIL